MSAIHLFTDKEHTLAHATLATGLCVPGAQQLEVRPDAHTGFMGFGVAITPASCYELSQLPPTERKALLQKLYGKEGLGLSVARLCIGSSDYAPALYSYDDEAFDVELTHFSVARDEEFIIPILREILAINPGLYLFASPWSPPYWMKTGGSMCGGYMRDEFLDCYAEYIIKFIKAYEGYGIRVRAITPQNETNTQQRGRMPACIWHPETEAAFVKLLREKLSAREMDVRIWMYDHNFDDTERVLWSLQHCEGLSDACDGVAFHYYGGAIERTAKITDNFPEMALHFTEGGPRLNDHYDTDFCKWGLMICRALRLGYRSFTGWNLMLNDLGGPNIGPFLGTCGGLVTRSVTDGALSFSGQYKALSHIAPHVTPDSRISAIVPDKYFGQDISQFPAYVHGVEGILIDNAERGRVAVLINQNTKGMQVQFTLQGTPHYLEMRPESISTVLLS